jgi:hypothetical protein
MCSHIPLPLHYNDNRMDCTLLLSGISLKNDPFNPFYFIRVFIYKVNPNNMSLIAEREREREREREQSLHELIFLL